MKLQPILDREGGPVTGYMFWCPGCKSNHSFRTAPADPDLPHLRNSDGSLPPVWSFDGNMDAPSFTDSLLYQNASPRCHLYVRNGMIEFCPDCEHGLAGQTVPLPDLEEERY